MECSILSYKHESPHEVGLGSDSRGTFLVHHAVNIKIGNFKKMSRMVCSERFTLSMKVLLQLTELQNELSRESSEK